MFSSSSISQEMVVVALQINKPNYWKLKPEEQIKLLSQRVKEICHLLAQQKRDVTWIIAWQEYGIGGGDTISVSEQVKNLFKAEFKKISAMYPNLILLAGSLLTKKSIEKDSLKKIIEYYKPLKWIEDIDKDYLNQPLSFEKERLEKLKESESPISVITNKARIYHRGEEKRHGKLTPYNEEKDEFTGYQPGKGKNLSPIVSVDHLNIGIEICREHSLKYSVLKKYVNESKVTPQLHFILSASIKLYLKSLCAEHYTFHIDSYDKNPPIITRGQKKNKMSLTFYRCDVLQSITKLPEPIAPVYPLQYQIMDLLEEGALSQNLENRMILQNISERVIHYHGDYLLSDDDYVGLKKELAKVAQVSEELYEKLCSLLEKSIPKPKGVMPSKSIVGIYTGL